MRRLPKGVSDRPGIALAGRFLHVRGHLGGSAGAFEHLAFVFCDGGGTVVRVRGQREAEQVRPTGRVVIDRGTTVSSQAAISAVNRESQPGSRSISRDRAAAGSSTGIPLVANQSSAVL